MLNYLCVVLGVKIVRKERVLKYLILTFVMIASFFMFSKVSARAVETINVQGNLNFELEEVITNNELSGYSISGVNFSCETGATCENVSEIDVLNIPSVYNEYPIVSIKDGNDGSNSGVLTGLVGISINKIVVGENIAYIGECAFCNLNVKEVALSSNVIDVNDYAFANSAVEIIAINRYDAIEEASRYTTITSNTFALANKLDKIVLPNSVVYNQYKTKANIWKDDSSIINKLTYGILYKFYDGENLSVEKTYYFGRELGELPTISVANGFEFVGWYYENTNDQLMIESYAKGSEIEGVMMSKVQVKWQLAAPTMTIGSYFAGEKDLDNKIVYAGKNNKLDIIVDVSYDLVGHSVSYSWKSKISGIENFVGTNSNTYSISYVSQSGLYTCYVTVSYVGYERVDEISLNASIETRKITVNVKDKIVNYGEYAVVGEDDFELDNSTALVEGEMIKNFAPKSYTNSGADIFVGDYFSVLEAEISEIGYENDVNNYVSNYDISYVNGDLHVVQKVLSVGLLIDSNQINYGDEENLTASAKQNVYVSTANLDGYEKNLTITYFREMAETNNVGEYRIIGVSVNDDNYSVNLDSDEYKFVINPKKVDVNLLLDNQIYDGTEKNISVSYNDINGEIVDLKVSISKDNNSAKLINAGVYNVVVDRATVDANYELKSYQHQVVIEKAESEFIGAESQIKTYNGLAQNVDVKLNHNEGTITYSGAACIDAHTSASSSCSITASVKETANYKAAAKVFRLYINKYELSVQPDLFEITYGNVIGDSLTKKYIGVNNEEVIVTFSTNVQQSVILSVNTYDIHGVSSWKTSSGTSSNYIVKLITNSGKGKIKVVPAPVEVMFYFYENLVYDGNVKNIGVRVEGTNENVGLQTNFADNKVPQKAGNYRLNVSLSNDNFYIVGKDYLDFSIAKATYDISNLKLNDKKVTFNFKGHSILLEGQLPEGLNVSYTIDDKVGNGTLLPFKHKVKVTFTGDFENYNYVESLEATLNVSMTWVWIVLSLILVLGGGGIVAFFLLIKTGKLRFVKKVKRSTIRNIIKKNREIDFINQMIASKRASISKEEDITIVEEPVKFIKNPNKINLNDPIVMAFVDELFKAKPVVKQYYSEMKNELLSYAGIVSKIKRDYETFYLNNIPVAKLDVEDGVLYAYFALDPKQYKTEQYNHTNVSKKKEFAGVPMKLRVNSIESLRHAKMFVRIIRKRENIKAVSNYVRVDYAKIYTAKEGSLNLFKKVFEKKKKKDEEVY